MQEKLEQVLAKLKEINGKLSKRNRILLIIGVAAIIVIALVGALLLNSSNTSPLFVELTQQEATEILEKLQEMEVNANYSNGTITVPSNQTDALRAQLVLQGYPKSGLSYEVFQGNVSGISPDSDRETYKLYDLQDRISATIRYFDGVQDAIVTISTGNDSKYVLQKDKLAPSASVAVFMRNGGVPEVSQVQGIKQLVAAAVPGMNMEDVVVLDGSGNYLSGETEMGSDSGTVRLKMTLEQDIERTIQAKVMYLLAAVYGEERVRVSVNCNVDVKKKLQEIINYIPSQDNRGVIERETLGIEAVGPGTITGGVPGVETNALIPIYPNITSDGADVYYTDERAFEYLVSQMKEQIQDDGGDIVDLTVGVVLDEEQMSRTVKQELQQLIAVTAGIDSELAEQKVSLVTQEFATGGKITSGSWFEMFEQNPMLKWILLGVALLLLIIIVVVILILRNMKKKKQLKEAEEAAAAAAALAAQQEAEGDGGEIEDVLSMPLDQMKKTREMELKEQIGEFSELNPEIAAQLIKTWLKGGNENE